MNLTNKLQTTFWLLTVLCLTACGGNNDPVIRGINDGLDPIIEEFYSNRANIYPGETLRIEWTSREALIFDMKLYVSTDRFISNRDPIIIEERCGVQSNNYCAVDDNNIFECDFESDDTFDCYFEDRLIKRNDLYDFLNVLPKEAYLILELCNDGDCRFRTRELTFH